VIKNGKGPGVLLMAGNHGDEYEGQIGLCKLVRTLEPSEIRGCVIILTAVNLPAALAGSRTSPIDNGNFSRVFPGDPNGTPTSAIAHYVDSVLFPMVSFFVDLHSGGTSLDYIPLASMWRSGDPALDDRAITALKALGAPLGMIWGYAFDSGFAQTAALRRGLVCLGGEFGGGGSVSVQGLRILERAIQNVLAHAGCISSGPTPAEAAVTRLMEMRNPDYFCLAPDEGLFEPFVELGQAVTAGQECGKVHFVDNPAREPVATRFRASGMVISKRHLGRVERGDCVAHLATDREGWR
jgi:predicted deacylase